MEKQLITYGWRAAFCFVGGNEIGSMAGQKDKCFPTGMPEREKCLGIDDTAAVPVKIGHRNGVGVTRAKSRIEKRKPENKEFTSKVN